MKVAMWKAFVALMVAFVALLAAPKPARAQSAGCQYIVQGAVLTAGQWNFCFQQKQDNLGFPAVNKNGDAMIGPFQTVGATTGHAGFTIAPGVAPTSPNNGDIWETSTGLFARVNGSTAQLLTGAGVVPFVSLPPGSLDTVLGYFGSTTANAIAVPNCSNALNYSTSTHTFSCNTITGTGTVTSVTPGNGLVSSTTAGCSQAAITTTGTLSGANCVDARTTTTETINDSDRAKLVTFNNASAVAASIAQAGAASNFQAGWFTTLKNIGAGTVTLTATTSTIDGSTQTPTLLQGESTQLFSDGTNYFTGPRLNSARRLSVFTASGTFTPPAGVYWVQYDMWGGGGGSGGASGGNDGAGGGAGAHCGGTAQVTPGTGVTVTVGAAGSAGLSTPTAGGNGGNTSIAFAAGTITAQGGSGSAAATSAVNGGAGGVCTGSPPISEAGGSGQSNNYVGAGSTAIGAGGAAASGGGNSNYNGGAIVGNFPGGGASGTANTLGGAAGGGGEVKIWY